MPGQHQTGGGFLQSKAGLALIVFLAIAAFFFLTEHRAHVFGWLPYLILLACPLMHFFHHGGHGGHSHQHGERPDEVPRDGPPGGAPHKHQDTPGGR